eukprot:13935669-Alexandrium_andersonii.AAC.1
MCIRDSAWALGLSPATMARLAAFCCACCSAPSRQSSGSRRPIFGRSGWVCFGSRTLQNRHPLSPELQ